MTVVNTCVTISKEGEAVGVWGWGQETGIHNGGVLVFRSPCPCMLCFSCPCMLCFSCTCMLCFSCTCMLCFSCTCMLCLVVFVCCVLVVLVCCVLVVLVCCVLVVLVCCVLVVLVWLWCQPDKRLPGYSRILYNSKYIVDMLVRMWKCVFDSIDWYIRTNNRTHPCIYLTAVYCNILLLT